MPWKSKTPAEGAGASRDSFAGLSHPLSTPLAMQVQTLICAHHVRPEMAVMVAALAFVGHGHG